MRAPWWWTRAASWHEQSETLAELDHDLREKAESRGLHFERVPVPHDRPQFTNLLADLVEPFITGTFEQAGFRLCRCRSTPDRYCLNTVLLNRRDYSLRR